MSLRQRKADGPCPFCRAIATGQDISRQGDVAWFADRYPVSPGHTLVVPVAHVADPFGLPRGALDALWRAVAEVQRDLVATLHPDGFNVGCNVGAAGGQTVAHAHIHVIPRYAGDVPDPRGGIRCVIPARAEYWQPSE